MAWSAADIPDQTGRVAVVTGANGGLGLETTRELARRGAHVVMAVRDLTKAKQAEEELRAELGEPSLELQPVDLASLSSIRAFAGEVTANHPEIGLLINNAGVMGTPPGETEDGFELQFGVNHLGHFALTALVLRALLPVPRSRVVTVTSTARHFRASYGERDFHASDDYDPWRAYGRSKMANVHFALGLEERLRSAGTATESLVAHPGFTNTDLQARSVRASEGGRSQRFFHTAVQRFGMSPAHGALPQLRAATDLQARGGELYTPRWVNSGPPVRRPILPSSRKPEDVDALWEMSQRETGIACDVHAIVRDRGV